MAEALQAPKKERDILFGNIKTIGILEENRTKKSSGSKCTVMCSRCNGFLAQTFFLGIKELYRESCGIASKVPIQWFQSSLQNDDDDFIFLKHCRKYDKMTDSYVVLMPLS